MRWLPVILFFAYVYIELSVFIQVAQALGLLTALALIIITSALGLSLVRNQGWKNLLLMQQKMREGENPAAEMLKSVSLIMAGLLLLVPGFVTDILALVLLLPPVQRMLLPKLMPHMTWRSRYYQSETRDQDDGQGRTFEGEYQRKKDDDAQLTRPDDPPHR